MKTFDSITMKIGCFICVFTFALTVEAKVKNKENKNVDMKCFVELVGGGDIISFWHIPKSKASNLAKSIKGHKIAVPNSKQKTKIYRVYECTLLKDDFTTSRAKMADKETAR